jgi:two-component system cell cycle sensor histidine kinase/response regulator CckA
MSPEVRARLFEPFFTTKAPGSGTGLGLATCDGIIKQSGGHITVQTEVGRGTTFRVYLPSVGDAKETSSNDPFSQRMGAGEAVLLVEDEEMVRDLGGIVLTSLGYRVILAANGREALKKLAEHRDIELLVTDVVMPDMGGKELARRVKLIAPELKVLFTSGYAFDAVARQDLSEDGYQFLPKPYTGQQLSNKVRDLLKPAPAASKA